MNPSSSLIMSSVVSDKASDLTVQKDTPDPLSPSPDTDAADTDAAIVPPEDVSWRTDAAFGTESDWRTETSGSFGTSRSDAGLEGPSVQRSFSHVVILSNRQIGDATESICDQTGKASYSISIPAGGLATALASFTSPQATAESNLQATFVSWNQGSKGKLTPEQLESAISEGKLDIPYDMRAVVLTEAQRDTYYNKVANDVLWPRLHSLDHHANNLSQEDWKVYRDVNLEFAKTAVSSLREDSIVWIHDYHLMCSPAMVRDLKPDVRISYFHHTPWPAQSSFSNLFSEQRLDIISGLLGADQIGFHTEKDLKNFIGCVRALNSPRFQMCAPGEDPARDQILVDGRPVLLGAYPISVDYDGIKSQVETNPRVKLAEQQLKDRFAHLGEDHKIIFGVERLDYTKGLMERIQALNRFLTTHPEYKEHVTLVQHVSIGRQDVPAYRNLKTEVLAQVKIINKLHGTEGGWQPIQYSEETIEPAVVFGYARAADLLLVTPLMDGMNLVCKEGIAANDKPTGLILGAGAGAAQELNAAYLVDASDPEKIAQTLATALDDLIKNPDVIRSRFEMMDLAIRNNPISKWQNTILDDMNRLMNSTVGSNGENMIN